MNDKDFTPAEEQMINEAFALLLDDYAHTAHVQRVEIITRAFGILCIRLRWLV